MTLYYKNMNRRIPPPFKSIISTVKPTHSPSTHVLRALESWEGVTEQITFFNIENAIPWRPSKTKIKWAIPQKDPPQLIQLIAEAAQHKDDEVVAIVNSDILLDRKVLNINKLKALQKWRKWAATSPRWTYEGDNVNNAKIIDYGIDIFVAPGLVWQAMFEECPPFLRMGCILWDNWVNCWLKANIEETYVNMRPWRCVFHPVHEEGQQQNPYTKEEVDSLQFTHNGFPAREFRI